jgi:hypothetical protein
MAEEYWEAAAKCRARAERAPEQGLRDAFMRLAQSFDALARQLELLERIGQWPSDAWPSTIQRPAGPG